MESPSANKGLCNQCHALVPARREQRENLIYLIKECPSCGDTETLISTDARRYYEKHKLDIRGGSRDCELQCLQCRHNNPNIIFLDITNRCNLNCPICINNTPSMGFVFDPPIEYFDKLFKHFAQINPKPSVQLFGGEPTVRKDLFEIIKLARGYGLPTRVTTKGIKLADEDYCRELIQTHATILIAYDGENEDVYTHFRGNSAMLAQKRKALDNIEKIGKAKVVVMSLVARGFNDDSLPDVFQFCHERRNTIRGLYLMPLAETFNTVKMNIETERITTEDIEKIFNDAFPNDAIDFIPAGLIGQFSNIMKYLKIKPVPFTGAHPNCESLYLLVSDGEKYVPFGRYLKGSMEDLGMDAIRAEKSLAQKVQNYSKTLLGKIFPSEKMKSRLLALCAARLMLGVIWKNFKFRKLLKGRGLGKVWHFVLLLLGLALGRKSTRLFRLHSRFQSIMQIVVLPFEDKNNLETERLSRCPAAFAFWNPEEDRVQFVPVCAWNLFKDKVMRQIADYYKSGVSQEPSKP